jgi:2-oxoglutarate ferredoxin oxidoreductase subunit alpha
VALLELDEFQYVPAGPGAPRGSLATTRVRSAAMSSATTKPDSSRKSKADKPVQELLHAAIRFAGDSGDGMQLAGTRFTNTTAVVGNDISTFPDYPSEIRAPAGTLGGVSGFQVNFGSHTIHTPGDQVDALIAMNPAALKINLKDLAEGGMLIVNTSEFTESNLQRAGFNNNPLDTDELSRYRLYKVPITDLTMEAVKDTGLGTKQAARCKNFFALGLAYWLYERPLETTLEWIETKFAMVPAVAAANTRALKAGYDFGETAELFAMRYRVEPADLRPGKYRSLTGNQATALGFVAAAMLASKPLFYGSYPITPASDILHQLSHYKNYDVRVFQAEDEIAAMNAVIGAAFAGAVAVTGTSGPGSALKQEAIGLAVMTELPCVIVNVQRAGPSTGLPTKTEQSDLWQTVFGRNGDCPVPVIAARSAADCFDAAIEAVRIAVRYMTPVFLLSDGYLANCSAPWRIPDPRELKPIEIHHASDPKSFQPYQRDENGARPWAIPGTPGMRHRVGGLEKEDVTGNVCYFPENHQRMTDLRTQKMANIVRDIPEQDLFGQERGELLLVSWGGTYGAVRQAAKHLLEANCSIGHMHIRWLNPLPHNVGDILRRFKRVLVCELNTGQLRFILQGNYQLDLLGLNKVQGQPFKVVEVVNKANELLGGKQP